MQEAQRHRHLGLKLTRQRGQRLRIAIGRQRDNPPIPTIAADQIQRGGANRTGGAKNGY